jgi:hypothetical protein
MSSNHSRIPRSAEQKQRFWREMIKAQASGNLAVKPFCKQQNISDAAFYQWRIRLARLDNQLADEVNSVFKSDSESDSKSHSRPIQQFTELVVKDSSSTLTATESESNGNPESSQIHQAPQPQPMLQVHFGEIRIEIPSGFDPQTLQAVLGMLRSGSC